MKSMLLQLMLAAGLLLPGGAAFAQAPGETAAPFQLAENVDTVTGGGLKIVRRKWLIYAVDQRGRYGFSYGNNNVDAARSDALAGCGNGACRVVMQAEGRCMAFADTHSGGYWYGHAYAGSLQDARTLAVGYCAQGGAAGCSTRHSACLN